MIFVTSNPGKFKEAEKLLGDYPLQQSNLKVPEIQADSLSEIAVEAAKHAFQQLRQPCFVEDSGLFIHEYKGFPGPYSHYAFDTMGNQGIVDLMENKKNRTAEFRCVIAYATALEVRTFMGRVHGDITDKPRGNKGFGFDPIFQPHGHNQTFAEDPFHKSKVSHRAVAFKNFKKHLGLKEIRQERQEQRENAPEFMGPTRKHL
jgi:XTP/dITP diphosphohydrolase